MYVHHSVNANISTAELANSAQRSSPVAMVAGADVDLMHCTTLAKGVQKCQQEVSWCIADAQREKLQGPN